jgi:hypothetical protein
MFGSLPQDSPALESKFQVAGSAQNHRARSSDSVVAAAQARGVQEEHHLRAARRRFLLPQSIKLA